MNGKGPPSSGGEQPGKKSGFGELKNQGRNSDVQNSPGRTRANAVFQTPTGRERSNAVFNTPGRSRSNAVTDGPGGFKQIKNEGRSQLQKDPDRPVPQQSSSHSETPQFGNVQNLGRNAFQSAKDNRSELTPKQQAGFSLVSGFMEKIMKEADRANAKHNAPGDKRNQQGQGSHFGQHNEEEEKRRLSMQSAQRDDDEDISAGDFFKRLQGALANPEKFRKEAAQRAADKQDKQLQPEQIHQQQGGEPPSQTRQRGGTVHSAPGVPNPLKDPGGYKRHQQQPNSAPDKSKGEKSPGIQQQNGPGKGPQQRPPGGGQTGPSKQQGIKNITPLKQPPRQK